MSGEARLVYDCVGGNGELVALNGDHPGAIMPRPCVLCDDPTADRKDGIPRCANATACATRVVRASRPHLDQAPRPRFSA